MTKFHNKDDVRSWGRILKANEMVAQPLFGDDVAALAVEGAAHENGVLATGLGRSYSDSCVNHQGAALDMTRLNRILSFDAETGILRAQAGLTLADILTFAVPRGYFLPVTPGTQFVTLGGAVANDVHGKNHHSAGSFGNWVTEIGLVRTDGSFQLLTPADNSGLFAATIGGLGLTGIISHVGLTLKPIQSSLIDAETVRFRNLDTFFDLSEESESAYEYTISWIDCLASGNSLGRGFFSRANHATTGPLKAEPFTSLPDVPFNAPSFALNRFTISAFNTVMYGMSGLKSGVVKSKYRPFFYPLDAIGKWNRLYGRRGFYQYQCAIPPAVQKEAVREMLQQISKSGQGSFLAVLKTFGDIPSKGLMSFPMKGATLALDFPNRGERALSLLSRLDDVVREAGGRNYAAKDGRLSMERLEQGYPNLAEFTKHIDPGISSSFWRRVNQ